MVERSLKEVLEIDHIYVAETFNSPSAYSYSITAMANIPEIQLEVIDAPASVSFEIKTIQNGTDILSDDEFGRGFIIVVPGGSITYPLNQATRWLHFNETADGMREALSSLLPEGFTVIRREFPGETYAWDIILPKNDTFGGETMRIVESGGSLAAS